jgi:PKD domain-containing protein
MKRATVASRVGLAVALFAIGCTESIGPERVYPGVPLFSYSANGVTLNKQNGALGGSGQLLIKGFNPTNPHHGDAIIATFFWLGSTNIIDSVRDVLTTAPSYTPVGNRYTLVEYVTAGGYSMATYIATNVQGFPDPNTDPNQSDILAVGAYLSQSVADGGVALSSWTGVEDNFATALGNHRSASGSGAAGTAMPAQAGPIAINAGALAYTVTMSGLYILDGPAGYTSLGQGSDNSMKEWGAYAVQTSAGTIDPVWQWFNGSGSTGTWLATNLALNTATAPASNGNLTVTTSTTGSSLDPDGYTVVVDGGPGQPIAINNSTGVTFTNLAAGSHSVVLSGVASNCTVSGGNTQTVNVPSGGTATTAFSVSCTATTGNLTVTTSTTGSSLDPDGYTVTVDGGSPQAIGINASVSYTNLAAGNHTVAIAGVATNCTVSGGPSQTVSVPSGGTATAAFTVSCSATTGNLTVSTSTTGSSLDPDGYTVTVDGGSPQAIGINASVSYTNLAAGNHTVAIAGVATNCTVSGGTSRTVSVPSGSTATTTFSVSCTTPPGNLTVSTSTTGSSLDPDGYTVTVDGGSPQSLGINASVSYTNLAAGNHTVAISGVATNCTVSGGTSRTVSVPSGSTATTSFSVTCTTPPGNLAVSTSSSGANIPNSYTVTVDGSQSQTVASTGSVTFTNLSAASHTVVLAVPSNCTVSGGASRTVTVPSGGTATLSYSVSCNAPPVVNAGPDETALTGLLYTLRWSFTDANHNGPWSYTINWGDGSTSSGTVSSEGSFSAGHTYVVILPRSFTIRVTVRDAAGASASDTKVISVLLL